jgi:hypothetical protein
MSAKVDGVRKHVVLTVYCGMKAYRESMDKHPRGLDGVEWSDLCLGWFFFGESIQDLFEAGRVAALVI